MSPRLQSTNSVQERFDRRLALNTSGDDWMRGIGIALTLGLLYRGVYRGGRS